jgi:predicted DNA-binding transcriptional regulator AlpA
MRTFSTRYAAKKLGIDPATLSRYITSGKIPSPTIIEVGGLRVHSWTDEDIERVRALLPNIPDGRKTRYLKQKKSKSAPKRSKP